MKDRIYVCHTFYHLYVALLKEYNLPKEKQGNASIVLSTMSNDFGDIDKRLKQLSIIEDVFFYDEKRDYEIEKAVKYHAYQRNPIKRIIYRIKYTKACGEGQVPYIPVDFKQYRDVYVFCDSDPIGYYLNYKHIYYHSVEDGLNSILHTDAAHFDNKGNFAFKAFMAKLNLFFIQNGYSKYCKDVEVNQIEGIMFPQKFMIEVPRKNLEMGLNDEQKNELLKVFVRDIDKLTSQIASTDAGAFVLILTEPLCTLDVRKQIFTDLIAEYEKEGTIVLKPHPRDEMDYYKEFPDYMIIDPKIPMEILNYLGENFFEKAVTVFTDVSGIRFAREKVMLGSDFMDKYEDPIVHRKNETIKNNYVHNENIRS